MRRDGSTALRRGNRAISNGNHPQQRSKGKDSDKGRTGQSAPRMSASVCALCARCCAEASSVCATERTDKEKWFERARQGQASTARGTQSESGYATMTGQTSDTGRARRAQRHTGTIMAVFSICLSTSLNSAFRSAATPSSQQASEQPISKEREKHVFASGKRQSAHQEQPQFCMGSEKSRMTQVPSVFVMEAYEPIASNTCSAQTETTTTRVRNQG